MKRKTMLTRAVLAALGIVAVAVLAGCGRGNNPQAQATPANMTMATSAATAQLPPGEEPTAAENGQAPNAAVQPRFAQVVAVQPITQSVTSSKPRQVCRDEQVAVPETYKDKNQIGGAVVGGLVGALAGHQVGGGKGKTLATVAGAVAGGYAGKKIQEKRQHPNVTTTTEQKCETVNDTSTKVVGYNVRYEYNGVTRTTRMDHDPGDRVQIQEGVVAVSDAH